MTDAFDPKKALYWGTFLECARSMYAPGVPNPPQPTNFPTGWNVTRNITAEAVVGCFRDNEFLGFVAESLEHPNQFVVAMHGTESLADFLDDFEFVQTNFAMVPDAGRTEYGFTRFYEAFSFVRPDNGSMQNLNDYLRDLQNATPALSFTILGYSLGGALATLHAMVLANLGCQVEVYTFASPMVGDVQFAQAYNALVPNSLRLVNKPDIVPQLPGTLLGYRHVETLVEINSLDRPELRRSIVSYHQLTTYLDTLRAMTKGFNHPWKGANPLQQINGHDGHDGHGASCACGGRRGGRHGGVYHRSADLESE